MGRGRGGSLEHSSRWVSTRGGRGAGSTPRRHCRQWWRVHATPVDAHVRRSSSCSPCLTPGGLKRSRTAAAPPSRDFSVWLASGPPALPTRTVSSRVRGVTKTTQRT